MIVTIDGPAGAGKSTVARQLAQRLGYRFLDTGAMYRAVAWAALVRGVPLNDPAAIAALAGEITICFDEDRVFVDDVDVTQPLRQPEVTLAVRPVADNADVRRQLGQQQRRLAEGVDLVTEGRDQGTDVFPDAECKIYLTASAEERACRRHREMTARGIPVDFDEVLAQQKIRDQQDRQRPVGRLRRAPDAVELDTTGMTEQEVVERLIRIVHSALNRIDDNQR